ncbi:MAG TPA: hypothetical protein ENN36_09225 [Candidatus Bathyarchaeota archaeon]|nr:hypothetical protein [Candidatus Bathyarchaeota archaeon]
MGKATILTPLYISVAWTLMTSYQLFTQTTVETVTTYLNMYLPTIGAWLAARIDMIVFIHSFAWIFLLSSFIPSLLLGKQRGVLIQFGVCLTLAFFAFIVQDAVATGLGNGALDQILGLAPLFRNPVLATVYLALPYVLMVVCDIRGKKEKWFKIEMVETETDDFPKDTYIMEDDSKEEEEKTQKEEWRYQN